MDYIDYLKTKVRDIKGVFIPMDQSGRIALPSKGDNPCNDCGNTHVVRDSCFHEVHCGAMGYFKFIKGEDHGINA